MERNMNSILLHAQNTIYFTTKLEWTTLSQSKKYFSMYYLLPEGTAKFQTIEKTSQIICNTENSYFPAQDTVKS